MKGPARKHGSLWADAWIQFRRHKGAVAGIAVLLAIVLGTLAGPVVYTHGPFTIDVARANQGVSWEHPLGTDNVGRDMLARVMTGGRISLAVGIAAMALAITIGTTVGVLAGFFRPLDSPLMRLTDLFLALPLLPLLLVIIMLFRESLRDRFGPEAGVFLMVVVVIGVTGWMQTARVVRGEVLAVKEKEFVLAATSLGITRRHIIARHILPNVLAPVTVAASLGVAVAIITESALSFLGLGFPSDFPTWGRLLYDGKDFIQIAPARVIWPGIMISLTVLSVNFIGDGLRDAMDPKLRNR